MPHRPGFLSAVSALALCAAIAHPGIAVADPLTDLGTPAGTDNSEAYGISADGKVIVGLRRDTSYSPYAYYLTGGMWTAIGALPGDMTSSAVGVSADGRIIVGQSKDAANLTTAYFYDTTSSMKVGLINPFTATLGSKQSSVATAVSSDGSAMVGYMNNSGTTSHAFVYVRAAGNAMPTDLTAALAAGESSVARGLSKDGSVIVGAITNGGINHATTWTKSGSSYSPAMLTNVAAGYSAANGVSGDGTRIVGQGAIDANGTQHALLWTSGVAAPTDLGMLAGGSTSKANAISADGRVIVGEADVSGKQRAFRYVTATPGSMESLGLLSGGTETHATAVSADGSMIVGYGDTLVNGVAKTHAFLYVKSLIDIDNTGTTITKTANDTKAFADLRVAALDAASDYDCDRFGPNQMCVSFGGRYAALTERFSEGAGFLTLARRFDNRLRIGGFVEYGGVLKAPSGFDVSNVTPTFGAFAAWSERDDAYGLQAKVTAAIHKERVGITREVLGTTEPGSGKAGVTTGMVYGELGYGLAERHGWRFTPYAALRLTSFSRDAYSEATTAAVTMPFSYAAYSEKLVTAILGGRASTAVTDRLGFRAAWGLEFDLSKRVSDFTATSAIPGLTSISIPDETPQHRARLRTALGLTYAVAENQTLSADVIVRGQFHSDSPSVTTVATYRMAF